MSAFESVNPDRVRIKKQVRSNRVINLLRVKGEMSRFDISKATGYSPPVITLIVEELIEEGFIREMGKGKSSGGRRPVMIQLIAESSYIIGIDIGKNQLVVILMDLNTNIVSEVKAPSRADESPGCIAERLIKIINDIMQSFPRSRNRLKGIGVALPGLIEQSGKLTSPDLVPFQLVPEELVREFNAPVFIDNDTRMMALGEKWFGRGFNFSHFVFINLGYGIGAGLVINNEVYPGAHGHSGEFGHSLVDGEENLCHCGRKGCLETVAGGWAIEQKGKELVKKYPGSILSDLVKENPEELSVEIMAEASRKGDLRCEEIFKIAAKHIGHSISAMINLLNPELVIIGGGLSDASDIYFKDLTNTIKDNVLGGVRGEFQIEISSLKEKAGPLGACAIVLEKIFQSSYEEVVHLV
jgi:N-acetylglucosamine repressor